MKFISKINHITLTCRNLAESIEFYQNILKFTLIATWEQGAYLESGDVWLCLERCKEIHRTQGDSHIAFNLCEEVFDYICGNIVKHSIKQWKKNTSEGPSLYLEDPDGHKLELHSGSLASRIESVKTKPYLNFQLHCEPKAHLPAKKTLCGIHTKLVPTGIRHTTGLYEAGNDEKVWQWLPRSQFLSVDDCLNWLNQAFLQENAMIFTIFNSENKIVGSTRYLDIDLKNQSLEIGYSWLNSKHWRSGVNTEAKLLLLENAFEIWNFQRVSFKTDKRNTRSQKAIERIGATYEGTFRASMKLRQDFWRDSVYYSIIASEWPTVKQNLYQLLMQ